MRIAVWHNLGAGGAKRALYDQVSGLLERGHDVEAWRPPTADGDFLPLSDLVHEHVMPIREAPVTSPRFRRLRDVRGPRRLVAALVDHCRSCAEAIDHARFDILLAGTCQFFGAPPLARYLVTPSVVYLQEPHRWTYEANPRYPWLPVARPRTARELAAFPFRVALDNIRLRHRRYEAAFEVENARAFSRILVNSFFSRENVLRVYGRDATVCYLGIDTTRFRPAQRPRLDVVVGLGALSAHKNAHLLVDAVGRIPPPRPLVVWVAYTTNPAYERHVLALARERNVALEIRERVGDPELRELLASALALFYAPRLEPFGLAALEANACGTPVVGVPEGGLRETIVDGVNGILTTGEPMAIARALERLRSDRQLAEMLGNGGRRFVEERWSREQAAEHLEHQLQAVRFEQEPRG